MGDKRRFDLFAGLLARHFPERGWRIADVAAGKGHLQMALRQLDYGHIVSFDRRPHLAKPHRQAFYRYEYFHAERHAGEFQLVAALHPDEGTDHSVLYAVRNRIPFLVCPCCLRPSAVAFHPPRWRFAFWVQHLSRLAQATHTITQVRLPLQGRNLVLLGTPKP